MKTAEIKALISELKTNRSASARDCIAAIETLLAREAAVNATLARLREAIRRQHAVLFYVTAAQELRVGFDSKRETTNEDR